MYPISDYYKRKYLIIIKGKYLIIIKGKALIFRHKPRPGGWKAWRLEGLEAGRPGGRKAWRPEGLESKF